ncbi:MAG TPA: VOC family protein [Myxococcota bacterium]|nr:VOC family protein [Myxococcota bacterium]
MDCEGSCSEADAGEKDEFRMESARIHEGEAMIGRPVRRGFHTVTPYLFVEHVDPVIDFMTAAFDARVTYRTTGSAGGRHVEVQIGDSKIMLGGDTPGGVEAESATFFLYVEDADAVYESALEAGADSMMPPDRNFEEKRGAAVVDPFGNRWFIATHDPDDMDVDA